MGLLANLQVRGDRGGHGNSLVNDSRLVWKTWSGSREHPHRERTKWSGKRVAKYGTQMLAMCTTLGALGYFTTLLFQQNGEQSTLRKGQGRFCHNS